MLQTIASAPVLMESFSQKYDFTKLLGEIMQSLDINTAKIAISEKEDAEAGMGQVPDQAPPDMQSQIPQAGAASNQADLSMSSIPQPDFPASRATPAS
jgi:hypothetical protein